MKVLVVEDDHRLADVLRRGLSSDGWTLDVFDDGLDGLWAATEYLYDAIVLDLMLPTMSGQDVVRGLRDRNIWTPILILTASRSTAGQAEVLDIGADDYLTKPFELAVLGARLRALVRRGSPARPTVLEVGDLRLDPAGRSVTRGRHLVGLTAREFDVLEFLVRNHGDVVSKGDLLRNVWDVNFDGDPNIIEVYVRCLRRKIDVPFGCRSIHTVRGAGYRLTPPENA